MTGVFFFIMMYTGSNILPIAKFLQYSHTKQAFRPDEVLFVITCFVVIFFASNNRHQI